MENGQELNIRPISIEGNVERPKNRFTVDEITQGSTVMSLEAAYAIRAGKIAPTGYGEAADFFKTKYGNTTDANCLWFMVEADKAGQLDKMKQEFPDVETRAKNIIDHMQRNNPQDLAAIMTRVQSPDYSPEQVRKIQEAASSIFHSLFDKKDSTE